jgi:hypothetical protein
MGDFPFACSITSSPNNLTLYDLWRRVPAWDKIRIRNTGGLWATDVGSGDLRGRVADDGMSMVKAYWENVDWMYNIVPVSGAVPHGPNAIMLITFATASHL